MTTLCAPIVANTIATNGPTEDGAAQNATGTSARGLEQSLRTPRFLSVSGFLQCISSVPTRREYRHTSWRGTLMSHRRQLGFFFKKSGHFLARKFLSVCPVTLSVTRRTSAARKRTNTSGRELKEHKDVQPGRKSPCSVWLKGEATWSPSNV